MGRLVIFGQYKNNAIQTKEKITHLTFKAKGFPNKPPAIYILLRFLILHKCHMKRKMKEKIVNIKKSKRKGKKYMALVKNIQNNKTRKIHFGASDYEQFKDSTGKGHYTRKNHGDRKRRRNYFSRHSGVKTKRKALKQEIQKSNGRFNPKILSHKYLW